MDRIGGYMLPGNSKKSKNTAKWIITVIAICILIYLALSNLNVIAAAIGWLLKLFMPLIIGMVMALILNVPMRSIEKHLFARTSRPRLQKLRRPLAIVVSFLIVIAIIFGISILVLPELANALSLIVNNVINAIDKLAKMEETLDYSTIPFGDYLKNLDIDWNSIRAKLEEFAKNQGGAIMSTAIAKMGSVVGGFFNSFIGIAFSIYMLFHKEKLQRQVLRLLHAWAPRRFERPIIHIASVFSETFRLFISAQTTEAIILGSLCTLGMVILRLPYAPMIGALVGVTALIPVIGAFIGTIVGAFMIITVDPVKTLIFVIFLLILQQIEGNLIYPKVVGSSIKLPAMWVLAAVSIGGSLGGPLGMLIGVPTTSALYTLLREATEKREAELEPDTEPDQGTDTSEDIMETSQ